MTCPSTQMVMTGLCETDHPFVHHDSRSDTADTVSSSTHSIDDILGNGKDNNHCANEDNSVDKGKGCAGRFYGTRSLQNIFLQLSIIQV